MADYEGPLFVFSSDEFLCFKYCNVMYLLKVIEMLRTELINQRLTNCLTQTWENNLLKGRFRSA